MTQQEFQERFKRYSELKRKLEYQHLRLLELQVDLDSLLVERAAEDAARLDLERELKEVEALFGVTE